MKYSASVGKSYLSLLFVLILLIIASIWVLHIEKQPKVYKRLPSGIDEQDIKNEQAKISEEPLEQTVKPINWKTHNGASVYFIPAHELPMVDIALTFDAGSARDNNHEGLANLTGQMLNQGVDGMTGTEVAQMFERQGAVYKCSVRHDATMILLRSLSEQSALLAATELLTSVIAYPAFPEQALIRFKKQIQAEMRDCNKRPSFQVERIFWEALYGDHPYAHAITGNEQSIESLQRQQLRDFHQQHYVARNLVIALTGNINEETARQLVDNISASLTSGEPQPNLPLPIPPEKTAQHKLVVDAEQVHIYLGLLGISRHSPDYVAMKVANYILDCKRLYPEVKAYRGLSYEVLSDFFVMRVSGPFIIKLKTRTDHACEVLTGVHDVLKEFTDNGITEDELDAARDYLRGSYPLLLADNNVMVATLSKMGFFDLPLDYADWFMREVQQLTVEQVNQAIKRQFKLDSLLQVIVGRDVIPASDE